MRHLACFPEYNLHAIIVDEQNFYECDSYTKGWQTMAQESEAASDKINPSHCDIKYYWQHGHLLISFL
jgi:hypothetical protein